MKYDTIVEHLRDQLAQGVFRPGDRIPSENHLARRFGVSRPTAGRALREMELAGLVERRPGSGTYVREPDRQRDEPLVLGLLVPGLGRTEVLDPICSEITRVGQERGVDVLWGGSARPHDAISEVEQLCNSFVERKVDGVFFAPLETVPQRERANARTVAALRDVGVAVVLLDRDIAEFPARSDLDLVGMDDLHAGMILGAHLGRLGRRRVRFLARPLHPSTSDLRAAGCRIALRDAGIDVDAGWLRIGDPQDEAFVRELLGEGDAVVCANDLTAALLLATLWWLGARVPEDLAVVGFDDVAYATLLPVPLTTVRLPCRAIGREAVLAALDRIAEPDRAPRQVRLTGELVVRRSCGSTDALAPGPTVGV